MRITALLFILSLILLFATSCSAQKTLTQDQISKIEQTYAESRKRGDEVPNVNMEFIAMYSGKPLMWISADNEMYMQAVTTVEVAGQSITFNSGQQPLFYVDGTFYHIEEAYAQGMISTADVEDIANTLSVIKIETK